MVIGVGIIALAGLIVFAVRTIWPRDSARAVGTDEAVERYRASTEPLETTTTLPPAATTEPVDPTPTLPAEGVYLYVTSGSESIDVLGGTTHPYPDETTLTVTEEGCGVLLRWDVLVERREEWRLCIGDDGIEMLPMGAIYHEFFGTGRLETQLCNGPLVVVPADGEPRPPVLWRCSLNDKEWLPVWEVLEPTELSVEGVPVRVTHVRMTVEDDDNYYEHTVVEWWLAESGLPVAMSANKVSNSDSGLIGDVVYREEYRADLVSLTPLT